MARGKFHGFNIGNASLSQQYSVLIRLSVCLYFTFTTRMDEASSQPLAAAMARFKVVPLGD